MTAFALPLLRAVPRPRWPHWTASGRRLESVVVAAIALFALASYTWNLGFAGYSTFYSAAARSMTMSWRAFWFGAFDPGAHITLDKLSGFLIPQALSARIFGYHPWSLALPQAIEGVITVLAVYVIGRRWRGRAVGVLAALMAAITPVFASMFGHVMEDGLLTMSLALATLCWQSAVRRYRLRSLVFAGLWIGIGFQAKMMQAWLVLPGLAIGLLLVAGISWRRQLLNLVVLATTAVTTSLAWMTVIQLVPGNNRPFIDGTTNNNIFSMVFGYNGFNRLIPNFIPGVITLPTVKTHTPVLSTVQAGRKLAAAPRPLGLAHDKLVLTYYASQIGWLYPAVAVGLVVEIGLILTLWRRRSGVTETGDALIPMSDGAPEAVTVALVLWLALAAGLLSLTQVPHVAYLAAIGVQLALLGASGLVAVARRYRDGAGRSALGLPLLVAASAAWACYLLWAGHAAPVGLGWVVLGFALLALVILFLGQLRPPIYRLALVVGVLSVVLAPLIWTGYSFDRATHGSAGEAYTGPRPGRPQSFVLNRPFTIQPGLTASRSEQNFLAFLAEQGGQRTTVLTDNWTIAATFLLVGRVPVLNMGGYSGAAPSPRLDRLEQLVGAGRIRFALLLHERQSRSQRASAVGTNDQWIQAHCSKLNPTLLGLDLYDPYVNPRRSIDLYQCSRP